MSTVTEQDQALGPIMECKICWYQYDPSEGDDVWQIAPDTPFNQLPDQWRCPQCDGEKSGFLVVCE